MEAMKKAWTKQGDREIEKIQFIDIKAKEEIRNTWRDFIFSHHFSVHSSFYTSGIANYPSRTCEALYWPTIYGKPVEAYPIPKDFDFPDLYDWYSNITNYE